MAKLLRVSGTRIVTPKGETVISSPIGNISIDSTSTFVTGNLTVNGAEKILDTTQSTSILTGALKVAGGVGIVGNTHVGGQAVITASIVVGVVNLPTPQPTIIQANYKNVGSPPNPTGLDDEVYIPNFSVYDTAAHRKEAAVYFAGGVGIEKDLNVGGLIYGRITQAITATQLVVTATNQDAVFYPIFTNTLNPDLGNILLGDNTDNTSNPGGLTYNPYLGKLTTERVHITSTETSVNSQTGALVVDGDVFVSGAEYVDHLFTKFIKSTSGPVQIAPAAGVTEIVGDIRVLGDKPIGTAPVVTNVLYVTMDGDDTNDGRAQDPSRACRTIGAVLKSPYYQPGTQIRVSAGHYLEDNPLQLKPYTSIMGSDIRTTSIEPINKTQDLFHMNSGCYLAFMQFLNGRSGLLEGPYATQFNRGAYCTAFPPLTGDDRIDLFHSPYIQNCTNLTGPWLKDGTLFTPDQTVQMPFAVGTGTWEANTTSIVINFINLPVNGFINAGIPASGTTEYTGSRAGEVNNVGNVANADELPTFPTPLINDGYIATDTGELWVYTAAKSPEIGMSINAGQQNPGFFNARTLMLANKPFIQEQVVEYVNQTYPGFPYSQEKCFRDVGILVENIAYDATFGGNEKAVESGLAYYNGVVSLIAGQEVQTSDAINYINSLTQQVIVNSTCTDLLVGTGKFKQVINTALVGGDLSSAAISNLCTTIIGIINNGPSSAPTVYKSTGPDAAYVSAEILMQANRSFIQEDTLNWINNTYQEFPFNTIKCKRDIGLILDSISLDVMYPTVGLSQSNFAGLQYWNQDGYTGIIATELTTTTNAVAYLKALTGKIIQNITPETDALLGITRYQNIVTQVHNLEPGGATEVNNVASNISIIIDIISGNNLGWTDKIISNGLASNLPSVNNAYNLLQANKAYLKAEVIAYVEATKDVNFVYDPAICARDVGFMIDSVCFDLLHGGNRQSVQSGLSYYAVNGSSTAIPGEAVQTIDAFNYMAGIVIDIVQNNLIAPLQTKVKQNTSLPASDYATAMKLVDAVALINGIIDNGPGYANDYSPISLDETTVQEEINAFSILAANKEFIKAEIIQYINDTYNPNSFKYNEDLCYRDTGLIIDAVSQDILLGGNAKSIEAGLSYWNKGYNYVTGQESTTTMALEHARDIILQIISNEAVTPQSGTIATQVINPFFQYGGDYMPQQAVSRNFDIITTIIERGPLYAPPVYEGGGLFAATGINGLDVRPSTKVTSVVQLSGSTYQIGLSTSTVGFGDNATIYIGDILVFPKQNSEIDTLSLQYTGNSNSWDSRKVDPIGGMGGSLVDGAVISERSPIQSFVYDAFTQLTQGGHGVKITNNGYAQLVSVFTIFSSVGVQVDNGGIASIVNSNANFGDICLLSKGYGDRKFSGTIYNPAFKAYPDNVELNQYYPNGFWPNNAQVEVFLPDTADRPHISLVMEVVPPDLYKDYTGSIVPYVNEQGFSGFLNATPSLATLTTGTITITGINTDGIAIGNALYIRDINGDQINSADSTRYVPVGTVVTDIGYQSVTLSNALTSGGGDPANSNYFNLYFCGNAYYSVLSSSIANNPKPESVNILSTNAGLLVDQVAAHIQTLVYLNTLTDYIISNTEYIGVYQNTLTQTILPLVTGGENSVAFIDLRFGIMENIIGAPTLAAANGVIPSNLRTKTGTAPSGAGSAITLINANLDFIAAEIEAYIQSPSGLNFTTYDTVKCKRDVKLILQRLIYDLQSGGNYNSVYSGLSYWSRTGTHHIVDLGENVRRTDLFPDGSNVNFYQRSYISASGYVFEYVGAGTNYGALPQVGRADPVQGKETVQLGGGKVFFTSTDQNGDFRIGPGLVISQATGVLSGRTFTKSLFANMTPFILAVEGGAL